MPLQNPTPGDVHISRPLTDLSFKIVQDSGKFKANEAFPMSGVAKDIDQYYVYDPASRNRDQAREIAPGDEVPVGGYELSTDSYLAKKWGISTPVTDEAMANEDEVLSLFDDATDDVTQTVMIRRERIVFGSVFKDGVWSKDIATPAGGKWDTANSDPISDIHTESDVIESKTGFRPNKLLLGRRVYTALLTNDDVLSRIVGGATSDSPALVMRRQLAALFELEDVIPVGSIYDSSDEGATAAESASSTGFIVGDQALLYYAPDGMVGRRGASAAKIFNWTGLFGTNAMGVRIRRWREESRSSEMIAGETAFAFKVTSKALGTRWSDLLG